MDVPVFGQRWDPWRTDLLGYSSTDTIGDYGCALTSVAMVLKYYGAETDPRDLNNWLKANAGYYNDDLIRWEVAPGRASGVTYEGRHDWSGPADLGVINGELDAGFPAIVEVRLSGQQHFVVLKGRNGTTYSMVDPWYGSGDVTLNDRYGSPSAAIWGLRKYHGSHGSAPAVELYDRPAEQWYASNAHVPWRITAGSSTVTVQEVVDGTAVAEYARKTGDTGYVNLLDGGQGWHECWARVKNDFHPGWIDSPQRWHGGYDTVVPTVDVTGPATETWLPTGQTLSWSMGDPAPGSGFATATRDGQVVPPTGSWAMTEGQYSMTFTGSDNVGHLTSKTVGPYWIDVTPPTADVPTFDPPSAAGSAAAIVRVSVSGSDVQISGVFSLRVIVDGSTIGTVSGPAGTVPWDISALAPNTHHIVQVEATDKAGNKALGATADYYIDRTPPATALALAGTAGIDGWYTSPVTVTLNATDASGIRSTRYDVDGSGEQTYVGPFPISAEGPHTLAYWSFDATNPEPGNKEASQTAAVKVDSTPPTTPVVYDDGAETDDRTVLNGQWQSADPGSGIAGYAYAVTDTPMAADDFLTWSAVAPSSATDCFFQAGSLNLAPGVYYLRVRTRNGAGLWSASGQSDGIQVSGAALADRLRYGAFGSAGATDDSGASFGTLGQFAACTLEGNTNGRPGDLLTQPDGLGLVWAGFWQTDVPTRASAVAVTPVAVVGGEPVTVTVSLSDPAPWPYAEVALATDDPSAVSLPTTVQIPGGATSSAPFAVPTAARQTGKVVRIMATYAETAYADVTIRAYQTGLSVAHRSGVVGDSVTLKAYLFSKPDKAWVPGAWVTFKVDGSPVGGGSTDAGGQAVAACTVPAPHGAHTIAAAFAGDQDYAASEGGGVLTAAQLGTKTDVVNRTAKVKTYTVLKAYLYLLDNSPVAGKVMSIKLDGTTLGADTTRPAGYAQLGYTVAEGAGAGVRTIRGEFSGDPGYKASANTGTLTVSQGDLYIWPYVRTGKAGTSHPLKAYVRSLPDYVIQPGKAITFKVNGSEIGSGTVAADGWASTTWAIPAAEAAGAHTATALFAGDAWYKAVTANTAFNVVK
jgi:hypothetical protein